MSINLMYPAIGVVNIAVGMRMLVQRGDSLAKAAKRIADLDAGAPERYFEERRALVAYPAPATIKGWRIKGIALVVLGILLIGLSFF